MKINRYLPVAFLYFFINSSGLPFGLTYTAIMSPLFYWWVIKKKHKEILLPFFICLAPFFIAHAITGIDTIAYIISIVNYTAIYIFCLAFYTFLRTCNDIENIFRKIFIINFLLCVVAIPVYFTSFKNMLWSQQTISEGIDNFSRLKLFTYEPSYYALLFTPLFFFYFMQLVLNKNKINSLWLLPMLFLPYVLSFSIGAIGTILFSCIITYLLYFIRLTKKRRVVNLLAIGASASFVAMVIVWFFFPQNSLFLRLNNVFSGNDTSGNGRTTDAFVLAIKMIELKSAAFGIGAGQVKILGADIVRSYYLYDLDYNNIAIPNAAAETLAIFGWIGLLLRTLIEIFLFFYTKVWTNYFRMLLFLFIFVYHFTGSFITNIAEYVIWILAFTNAFPQFDVKQSSAHQSIHAQS